MTLRQRIVLVFLFVSFSACGRMACLKGLDFAKENSIESAYQHDLETLDPAAAKTDAALDLLPAIYETLYQYTYFEKTPRLTPLLAADFPVVSADRLTIKIPIRKGVLFHDSPLFKDRQGRGRELTAKDVVYSLKRLAHPGIESTAWGFLERRVVGMNRLHDQLIKAADSDRLLLLDAPMEGLVATDPFTVKILLTKPFPEIAHFLTMTATAIVPEELVKNHSDNEGKIIDFAVGTGPFELQKWIKGDEISLNRNVTYHASSFPGFSESDSVLEDSVKEPTKPLKVNETYKVLRDAAKPLPLVEQLRFKFKDDEEDIWKKFVSGDFGFIRLTATRFRDLLGKSRDQAVELESRGFQIISQNQPSVYFLMVNMKDRALGTNKLLRQSISTGIKRDEIINDYLSKMGELPSSIVSSEIEPQFRDKKLKYSSHFVQALELIEKAKKFAGTEDLAVRVDIGESDLLSRKIGEKIKKDLDAIGIKTTLVFQDFVSLNKRLSSGDYQLALMGWDADYLDAQSIFQIFYGPSQSPGINFSQYQNSKYDKIYEQYELSEVNFKRKKMAEELDNILQEDLPAIPLFTAKDLIFVSPKIKNLYDSLKNVSRYKYVRISHS